MKVTIIKSENWEGLYINNDLKTQDSKLDIEKILKEIQNYLGVFSIITALQYETKSLNLNGQELLENLGSFPISLSDIQNEFFVQ